MKVIVNRLVLLDILNRVSANVSKSAVLPITATVKIEADGKALRLTACNLESSLIGSCKAKVEQKGALCILPKAILPFLSALKEDKITLESTVLKHKKKVIKHYENAEGEKRHYGGGDFEPVYGTRTDKERVLLVQANGAKQCLEFKDPKEFPTAPKTPKGTAGTVKIADLKSALSQVDYAVAKEDHRPVFQGVCFSPNGKGVNLVASDGFRLAVHKVSGQGRLKDAAIIPPDSVKLLKKLMPEKITMKVKDRHAFFDNGDLHLVVQCISGTFPKYDQLIPKGGKKLIVDKDKLFEGLKLALTAAPDTDLVRLHTKGEQLVLECKNDGAKTETAIPCKGKAKIAFTGKYLVDMLNRLSGNVEMQIRSATEPVMVKQNSTIHLLMPSFVQW